MLENFKQKFINSDYFEKLEKLFFSLFILSIPFQTRLTFITPETYLFGTFNEYATFFIYLSDILLFITLFIYFVNLQLLSPCLFFIKNIICLFKKYFQADKNNKNLYIKDNLTKVSIFSIIKHSLSTSPQLIPILLLFLLISWSFISILWSNYQGIAIFKSFKLLELLLLFVYLNKRINWFGYRYLFALIFITGLIQSIIGILQYFYQHSLGLKLLGESLISPNIDNVAKIIVDNEKIIRAYGTFPHPNIFGAFLVLSIFSGIWLLLSFKRLEKNKIVSRLPYVSLSVKSMAYIKQTKQIVSRETILHEVNQSKAVFNITAKDNNFCTKFYNLFFKLFHVKQFQPHYNLLWLGLLTFGIVLQFYVFILTFSRIAWFGFVIVVLLILLNIDKLFHVKQFVTLVLNKGRKVLVIFMILSGLVIISVNYKNIIVRTIDSSQKYEQSFDNRVLYNNIAMNIIKKNPLIGVGIGNFTFLMDNYTQKSLDWWQYQPVHNIYLLITAELGIVGIIMFLIFILVLLKYAFYTDNFKIISPLVAPIQNVSCETFWQSCITAIVLCFNKAIRGKRETSLTIVSEDEITWLKYIILSVFVSFLFMGLFDHYFWSFQQGQLIFWLVLAILFALSGKNN